MDILRIFDTRQDPDKLTFIYNHKQYMPPWKKVKLGDVAEIMGGGTPKTSIPEYWNGDIPWLSVVDFGNDQKFVHKTEKSISQLGLENSSTKILKKGQIIISARGTVGELAILTKDMAFNQSCYGLTSNKETTNEFLYYLLKFHINKIKNFTHGSVFDTITRETFNQIEVEIPDLPTQSRIASILSAFDDKIELNRQMNNTLEDMAQALYKKNFVTCIDPYNLPEGWRWGKLGELYSTTSGGTPNRKELKYFSDNRYPWVKSKELNKSFILETEEFISEEGFKNSSTKVLPKNSILIAMYGNTTGEYGILGIEATCNQAVCAILPNENYPYTYIYQIIKNSQTDLINLAVGSAQQNISQDVIQDFKILIPETKVVQKFYNQTFSIFEKIKSNLKEIKTLSDIRDKLLPKLISGEIPVDSVSLSESQESIVV